MLMGLGAFLVPTIVTLEQQAGAALEPESVVVTLSLLSYASVRYTLSR